MITLPKVHLVNLEPYQCDNLRRGPIHNGTSIVLKNKPGRTYYLCVLMLILILMKTNTTNTNTTYNINNKYQQFKYIHANMNNMYIITQLTY